MDATIIEVQRDTEQYQSLLTVTDRLNQTKYISLQPAYIDTATLFGMFDGSTCIGFLYCYIQVIGRDADRAVLYDAMGMLLREGYVEAFGVLPEYRRKGLGERLQQHAIAYCTENGCYQIRSRSATTNTENYALKLKLGYAVHPSHENNSYYFIKTLQSHL